MRPASLLSLCAALTTLPSALADNAPSIPLEDDEQKDGLDLRGEHIQPSPAPDKTVSESLFFELEELSRLVGIAYCVGYQGIQKPFECLSHCADFEGVELVETWNTGLLDSSSCGYVALSHHSPARIIVAFRGSNSLSDAVVDLMTLPAVYTPYEPPSSPHTPSSNMRTPNCTDCQVHSGFMSAWRTTRETIIPILERTRSSYPNYTLVLTGHSLGGAIAGLAALEFAAKGWHPAVTTFGEPRFGNSGLAAYVDAVFGVNGSEANRTSAGRYRRVTRTGDPVPMLPLEEWGWRMHAEEIFITKSALPPGREDLVGCDGDKDPECIAGSDAETDPEVLKLREARAQKPLRSRLGFPGFPAEWQLWQILFAHREYFWRLGLCWDPQLRDYPRPPGIEPGARDEVGEL